MGSKSFQSFYNCHALVQRQSHSRNREICDGLGSRYHLGCPNRRVVRPLALALAKTDMWEGHAGQTQANPFGFGIHLDSITCLHVTVLSGIPGICRADCYMHADCYMLYACNSARLLARPLTSFSRTPPTINSFSFEICVAPTMKSSRAPLLAANTADRSSASSFFFSFP